MDRDIILPNGMEITWSWSEHDVYIYGDLILSFDKDYVRVGESGDNEWVIAGNDWKYIFSTE